MRSKTPSATSTLRRSIRPVDRVCRTLLLAMNSASRSTVPHSRNACTPPYRIGVTLKFESAGRASCAAHPVAGRDVVLGSCARGTSHQQPVGRSTAWQSKRRARAAKTTCAATTACVPSAASRASRTRTVPSILTTTGSTTGLHCRFLQQIDSLRAADLKPLQTHTCFGKRRRRRAARFRSKGLVDHYA